jgi:hypothetical protein
MKQAEKDLKFPFITTVWPLNERADAKAACRKIQAKIITYGICSDREQAFLDKHTQSKSPKIIA